MEIEEKVFEENGQTHYYIKKETLGKWLMNLINFLIFINILYVQSIYNLW